MHGGKRGSKSDVAMEDSYTVVPMTENPNPNPNPSPDPDPLQFSEIEVRKKRGRPRKYGADGTVALSPMPISSSIPLIGWKRSIGRPVDTFINAHKFQHCEGSGERVSYYVGANFTPHVITVNVGEDVMMKVMSFSQQGSRAICILSATGTISNVTLRQPTSSGGTLTYEGHFEILSLSGSFMPTKNGGTKSRSGGMSVSLAGPDGRVMGGGLAGLLVAAGPVQVVVGSFLPGHQQEQNPRRQKINYMTSFTQTVIYPDYGEEFGRINSGANPVLGPSSSHRDDMPSLNPFQDLGNLSTDNNGSRNHDEAEAPSESDSDASCEARL